MKSYAPQELYFLSVLAGQGLCVVYVIGSLVLHVLKS
jgi:hypothetical protein